MPSQATVNSKASAVDVTDIPEVRLRRLEDALLLVSIEGKTPLIPHRWSEKSLGMMRQKQSGSRVRVQREPKDPEVEARDSAYWLEDGRLGMPATAFKAALIDACRHFEGLTMKYAKLLLFVEGEGIEQLVPIDGSYEVWEATPRNQTGVADLRYRMRVFPWRTVLPVRFISGRIDQDSVLSLVDAAGRGGVGDWRPSSPKSNTGVYGTWRVVEAE